MQETLKRTAKQNKEVWKDIDGFDGIYEVSSLGRIRSNTRPDSIYKDGRVYSSIKPTKILKNVLKTTGYEQVFLHLKPKAKLCLVHRLVAKAFIPNPENKPQVNHIDGNKSNNNVSNLEWVTPSENGLHAYSVLKIIPSTLGKFGKDSPKARAVIQYDAKTGKCVGLWDCASDAVRKYGFDSGGITRCCQGKLYSHKGYIWRYVQKKN